MSTTTSTGPRSATTTATAPWRTVDVVVLAVVGVASGVVFWAWNQLWAAAGPAFTAVPPLQGFMYGVWLVPGVLGALIVRKRGAAVFAALVAAVVSALLGTQWGLVVVWYGLVQGIAPELVFALALYRSWRLPTAVLAGAAAGLAAAGTDLMLFYPEWSAGWKALYAALVAASAAVVAGLGSWLLVRALARTGVLAPFASGREQADV